MLMTDTDWLELWRELSITTVRKMGKGTTKRYEDHAITKKKERPDPLLDFIKENTDSQDTVLDIGSGNGRWIIPLAEIAKSATAVEPADSMEELLHRNISDTGVDNITVIPARWEYALIEPHDIVTCAHAMYGNPYLADLVGWMERHAGKMCCLAMRLPPHNSIIAELSRAIHGHSHDSPNAIIAYNALYSLGIYANVIVEDGIKPWTNDSFDEALEQAKRHLRVESTTAHDELIGDTLARRLTHVNDSYIWPDDGMRSALLWWKPRAVSK